MTKTQKVALNNKLVEVKDYISKKILKIRNSFCEYIHY